MTAARRTADSSAVLDMFGSAVTDEVEVVGGMPPWSTISTVLARRINMQIRYTGFCLRHRLYCKSNRRRIAIVEKERTLTVPQRQRMSAGTRKETQNRCESAIPWPWVSFELF